METKGMTAEERQKSYFYEAQHMVYYDLPVLVSKIFHATFANCECGSPVVLKKDMEFIEGFLETLENTFRIAVDGQKKQLVEMLEVHARRSEK